MGSNPGDVNAILHLPNGETILAGAFTRVAGSNINRIVSWNGSVFKPLGSGLDGTVNAMVRLPNGDIIVGGSFSNAGGVPAARLARWNGSAWSPFAGGVVGIVNSMQVLGNGDLVVAGTFTSAGGDSAIVRIGRWDGLTWHPYGPGLGNTVNALTLWNGQLIAGGQFTNAGGNSDADRVALWDGAAWQPLATGTSGTVWSLHELPSGDLLVGGEFANASGVSGTSRIARWNGTVWMPLGTGISTDDGTTPIVRALEVLPNQDIIAGGSFRLAGGNMVRQIARWNGSTWSSLGPLLLNQPVHSICAISDSNILVGGRFSVTTGNSPLNRIGQWNGTEWRSLGEGLSDSVLAIEVAPDDEVILSGTFTAAGQAPASRVVRWNGSDWSALGAGLNRPPFDFEFMDNGDLIATGDFGFSGNDQVAGTARWNGTLWSQVGYGPIGNTIFKDGPDTFIIGGSFSPGVARWNGASFGWNFEGLTPGVYGVYRILRTLTSELIFAGGFQFPVVGIAQFLGQPSPSWAQLGSPIIGMRSIVAALELPNGDIVVAGNFNTVDGGLFNHIARWNGVSWSTVGSGVGLTLTGGSNPAILDMARMPNGDLIVAGFFSSIDGVPANSIARWNGTNWSAMGGGVTCCLVFHSVNDLQLHPNGELLVGGNFSDMGNAVTSYFARWTEDGVPLIDDQPDPQTINAGADASFAVVPVAGYDFDGPLMFQWKRNGIDLSDGVTPSGTTITGATTASLMLTNVAPAESGQYSVSVSNSCGTGMSSDATLQVNAPLSCQGDSNGDGMINFTDITTVLANFGSMCPNQPCQGDANGDGVVNFTDITTVLANFGASCP